MKAQRLMAQMEEKLFWPAINFSLSNLIQYFFFSLAAQVIDNTFDDLLMNFIGSIFLCPKHSGMKKKNVSAER